MVSRAWSLKPFRKLRYNAFHMRCNFACTKQGELDGKPGLGASVFFLFVCVYTIQLSVCVCFHVGRHAFAYRGREQQNRAWRPSVSICGSSRRSSTSTVADRDGVLDSRWTRMLSGVCVSAFLCVAFCRVVFVHVCIHGRVVTLQANTKIDI